MSTDHFWHEKMLWAAASLEEPLTLEQGRVLIALLTQGSSSDIECVLVRLVFWCRVYKRRDILTLLFLDPVTKAMEIGGNVDDADIQTLKDTLEGAEGGRSKWELDLLLKLQGEDPCLQLIDCFKDKLADRFKNLCEVYHRRLHRRLVEIAGKRCTVEMASYESKRYKSKHWVQALQPFIDKGVSPVKILAMTQREYRSVPWPESFPTLVDQYLMRIHNNTVAPASRFASVSRMLPYLIEADLSPAEVARLALNATMLGVQGLFLSKEIWVELAWSLLDGRKRTSELAVALKSFEKGFTRPTFPAFEFV